MVCSPQTRRGVLGAALVLVIPIVLVGLARSPANAQGDGGGFTTSAAVVPTEVVTGTEAAITIVVTAERSRTVRVDVEVRDEVGHRSWQASWDRHRLSAGDSRSLTTRWKVPAAEPRGTRWISITVYTVTRSMVLHHNAQAALAVVVGPETATPSSTTVPTTAAPLPGPSVTTVPPRTEPTPNGGIATGTVLSSPLASDLELIASIVPGGFVRSDYTWRTVQPTNIADPTRWSWARYDSQIDAVHGAGLRVVAMLGYTPAWANGGSSDDKRPPAAEFTSQWQDFCHQFAMRYIPKGVTVFEIWNEPNIVRFWSTGPNVAEYVGRVLIPCSTGLRAAAVARNRTITIITGGTAPAIDGTNIDPRTWASGLYAAGARPHFDAIGHHPYTWPYSPGDNTGVAPGSRTPNQWNAMIQTKDIRATMVRNGDAGKQIWATEVGLPSRLDPPTYPEPGHQNFVSHDLMVTRIGEIFSAWFGMPTPDDASWAGPLIWYQHRDQLPPPLGANTEGGFGVTDWAGADKPATGITPRQALTEAFAGAS